MNHLTLAEQTFEIEPLPFGKLRKIIASVNRIRNVPDDQEILMAETANLFGLLLGKTSEEIDAMPISFTEMTAAITIIPVICGLVEGSPESGEAQAVTSGIPSTAT